MSDYCEERCAVLSGVLTMLLKSAKNIEGLNEKKAL
jgi:hypothetical protein